MCADRMKISSHVSESALLINSKTSGLGKFIQARHSISFIERRPVQKEDGVHFTYFLPTMERLGPECDALNGDQRAISKWIKEKRYEWNAYMDSVFVATV